jgi:hypothetical protein
MHSSRRLDERARPEIVRNILGHVNIDVTQNVLRQSWWEVRVDAVTQAVEALANNARNAAKEEKRNQPESAPAEGVLGHSFKSDSSNQMSTAPGTNKNRKPGGNPRNGATSG